MLTKKEVALARGIKGPSQIERVRAARAIINSRSGSEAMALHAFMTIFHPEVPIEKVKDMARDLRDRVG